jgi:hypothetical protein
MIMSTTDNMRRIFTVSLSVPNTTGMGPIIIKAPPLVLPRTRKFLRNIDRTAKKATVKPAKISMRPTVTRATWLDTPFNPRILSRTIQISFNMLPLSFQKA